VFHCLLGVVEMTPMDKLRSTIYEEEKEYICDAPLSITYRFVLVGLMVSSGIIVLIVFKAIMLLFS